MATVESVLQVLTSPFLLIQQLNRVYYKAQPGQYNTDGVDVPEREWDNLVILDACRFDIFEAVLEEGGPLSDVTGSLSESVSQGSCTREFLPANFSGRQHDTVYVTSSPHIYKNNDLFDIEFHDVTHVWLEEHRRRGGEVESRDVSPDPDCHHPRHTTRHAREAIDSYPQKRLVVHYLPPHWPFHGEFGKEHFAHFTDGAPWQELTARKRSISRETVWKAHRENLEIALAEVETLLSDLDGKTVITSDHGQLIGDRMFPIPVRGFGHPATLYQSELVDVPWFEADYETRRNTVAEPPVDQTDTDEAEELAANALRDLGYLE
jgi:hypothetical protein